MRTLAPKQKPTQETGYQRSPEIACNTPARKATDTHSLLQLQSSIGNHAVQRMLQNEEASRQENPAPVLKKSNNTGLPDALKKGVENLSGYAMDDVKVHYNSNKPAQLNALAYTQGTEIHVAPRQEKHLPHEAWHVVQQKQGRVRPTLQMKGTHINDDAGLEKEADVMGAAAAVYTKSNSIESDPVDLSKPIESGPVDRIVQRQEEGEQTGDSPAGSTEEIQLTAEQRARIIRRIDTRLDSCANLFEHAAGRVQEEIYRAAQAEAAMAGMVVSAVLPFVLPSIVSRVSTVSIRIAVSGVPDTIYRAAMSTAQNSKQIIDSLAEIGKSQVGNIVAGSEGAESFVSTLVDRFERAKVAMSDALDSRTAPELLVIFANYDGIVEAGHDYYLREIRRLLDRYRQQVEMLGASRQAASSLTRYMPVYIRTDGGQRLAMVTYTYRMAILSGALTGMTGIQFSSWIDDSLRDMVLSRYQQKFRGDEPLVLSSTEIEDIPDVVQ